VARDATRDTTRETARDAAREPANDDAHGADEEAGDDSEDDESEAGIRAAGDDSRSDAGVYPDPQHSPHSQHSSDSRDEPIIVSLRAADEAEPDPLPLADATPIARAAASIAGTAHETPAAAPLAADDAIQIDVSGIKPVDATPPPAAGTYPSKPGNGKVGETSASKGARRK
jgi:hypothetical protein